MGINGGITEADPGQRPFVTFYVQVKDPQAVLDKAVRLGGKVIMPLTTIPNMVTYALFTDPDGCVVGVIEGPESVRTGKPARKPTPAGRPRRKTVRSAKRAKRK